MIYSKKESGNKVQCTTFIYNLFKECFKSFIHVLLKINTLERSEITETEYAR